MGTPCVIGYETENGEYRGTYCHWDGYPSQICPVISGMMLADVVIMVERAVSVGGVRSIDSEKGIDYFSDDAMECVTSWPDSCCHYAYRKKLDGSLEFFNASTGKISAWVTGGQMG